MPLRGGIEGQGRVRRREREGEGGREGIGGCCLKLLGVS